MASFGATMGAVDQIFNSEGISKFPCFYFANVASFWSTFGISINGINSMERLTDTHANLNHFQLKTSVRKFIHDADFTIVCQFSERK